MKMSRTEKLYNELNNKDEKVRRNALISLGKNHNKRAIDAIVKMLKDPVKDVQEVAACALWEASNYIDDLLHLGESLFSIFISTVCNSNHEYRTRAIAATAFIDLCQAPPFIINHEIEKVAAISAVIEKLDDNDEVVRFLSTYILGNVRCKESVPSLIEKLKDPFPDVRTEAGFALGFIGDPRAIHYLAESMNDKSMRKMAAGALMLIARSEADENLDETSGPEALLVLIDKLHDENYLVRKEAAIALGNIGDEISIESLEELQKDKYRVVARAASRAIDIIRNKSELMTLHDLECQLHFELSRLIDKTYN